MDDSSEDQQVCESCQSPVEQTDEFCPNCGNIFIEDVQCINHPDTEAEGVCIICCQAYCSECGSRVNKLFLCDEHSDYEIIEGLAKVYGINDVAQAEYIKSILEQASLHPLVYARKASPYSLGGVDYTLFRASGEPVGHSINELKVLVPVQEVQQAEEIIKDLKVE